jgi:hypothetical protein
MAPVSVLLAVALIDLPLMMIETLEREWRRPGVGPLLTTRSEVNYEEEGY